MIMEYNCDDCRADCAEVQKALCHKSHIETAKQLQAELGEAKKQQTCKWTPNEAYDSDYCWETECGKAYSILEGTPMENDMKFCVFCGGKLIEQALKGGE